MSGVGLRDLGGRSSLNLDSLKGREDLRELVVEDLERGPVRQERRLPSSIGQHQDTREKIASLRTVGSCVITECGSSGSARRGWAQAGGGRPGRNAPNIPQSYGRLSERQRGGCGDSQRREVETMGADCACMPEVRGWV